MGFMTGIKKLLLFYVLYSYFIKVVLCTFILHICKINVKYILQICMLFRIRMRNQHHGEILEQAIRQSSVAISKIAKKTGYSRTHIYNLFQQKNIDLNLLLVIGEFIHHDFSDSISQLRKYKHVLQAEYAASNRVREPIIAQNSFEQKYYALLQEHNLLLKKYNKLLSKK